MCSVAPGLLDTTVGAVGSQDMTGADMTGADTADGDRTGDGARLVGRDGVVSDLTAVVRAAAAGSGRSAVLHGAPGVGLSSIIEAVASVARGEGLDVVPARGRLTERDLHRTVLRDVAAAMRDPDVARTVAMSEDAQLPAEFTDAVLGRTRPTLLVVDDLDLADGVSLAALRYLAHRVERGPVSLLASCRDARIAAGLPTVEIRGLDERSLVAALRRHDHGADLADEVATALHRLTQGNPLAAIEISSTLTLPQRAGSEPLPDFPALGPDVVSALAVPLAALGAPTRHALALAAAEPTGDLRVLAGAAQALGVTMDALEPAEELGIVSIEDGRVSFDLPLRRWAVYHSVAAPSRRAAHRALAAAHDGPGDAERRALHMALGATEPDERIASDLELAAQSAERRGDAAAARQWWQHAARLSPIRADADARRRRARLAGGDASGPLAALTDAERRVAIVVGNGSSNKGAATSLGVSVKTVDTHLQSIYRKLGLRSRSELAMVVARHSGGSWEEVS